MSNIIEQAGLTPEEARNFVFSYHGPCTSDGHPGIDARYKIAAVIAAELEANRPPRAGDKVTFPFGRGEVFEVLLVHGDWVVGVGEDGIPTTLSLGAVERQA